MVDLQGLASRRRHLEPLVVATLDRVGDEGRVKRHLRAIGAFHDVLVEALVVRGIAAPARDEQEQRRGEAKHLHVASACSSVIRPS